MKTSVKNLSHQQLLDMVYDLLNLSPLKPAERQQLANLEFARTFSRSEKALITSLFNRYSPVNP